MTKRWPVCELLLALLLLACGFAARTGAGAEILPPGFRPQPMGIHALVGGTVFANPDQSLTNARIIIRDGWITAVGPNVEIPAEARVWDMSGTTIYAGFIDPYISVATSNAPVSTTATEPVETGNLTAGAGLKFFGAPNSQTDSGSPGPGYRLPKVTPELRALRGYSPKEKQLDSLRQLGFTAGVFAPAKGIVRGTSVMVSLIDEDPNALVLKPDVFQHVAFETHSAGETAYPGSLMGAIATVRQSFLDAAYYELDQAHYREHPQGRPRPFFDPSMEGLAPAAAGKMRVAIETGSALMSHRAARIADELKLDYCLVASGEEWRRPDLIRATGARFIVPLNFPELSKLPEADDWEQLTLDQLRAWDWAPENAAVLREAGLDVALTTFGLSDVKKFRPNLVLAMDRGFSQRDAIAALTTVPASLCGVGHVLGTIEPGKLANLTVVSGETYFVQDNKVREVWIEGRRFPLPHEDQPGKPNAEASPKPEEKADPKPKEEPERQPETPPVSAEKKSQPAPEPNGRNDKPLSDEQKKKQEQTREARKKRIARPPLETRGPLAEPEQVFLRHATVWTCGPEGILTNANVLISKGKILRVGNFPPVSGPEVMEVDAQGWHLTPGLIDAHSHSAILGGVNESTLPSTAMVRIEDVLNSETENIYKQLAGGVTAINLLHGSANPIGGQSALIKLRDGAGPEQLLFEGAPPGIKFALGENVKQSNWGARNTTRYPQTRMGVPTFMANRFAAAQAYLAEWARYRENGGRPPRRDLELETIGEILQAKRWIHCHAYRQDEILAFLRVMEKFSVQVGTLQHVLEGYKVADEIARHGAGGSTFADWWAYKFEVFDAIPYNGSLMRDRGVLVSFNSDSSDLARRLYTEAAKAVKYGGTSEPDALKFVTLNPASQLRVADRVGSIETGKDADFALWSGPPLHSRTVCLQTWIDGKKYFDRAREEDRATRLQRERADLIAKAKSILKVSSNDPAKGASEKERFLRASLEHEHDAHDRHCMD